MASTKHRCSQAKVSPTSAGAGAHPRHDVGKMPRPGAAERRAAFGTAAESAWCVQGDAVLRQLLTGH